MSKKFFIKRGEKKITIDFEENELLITLKIPTNYDHDLLMDEFTELSPDDSVNIKAPELIEERLIRFIIDLPFEIPISEEMDKFKKWQDATYEEKRIAIRLMDPKLRDKINSHLAMTSELTGDEKGK